MISLKRHIESHTEELLVSALDSYRGALTAMAESGAQACPTLGEELQGSLLALRDRLVSTAAPEAISATKQEVEQDLTRWGQSAAEYYKEKTREIKEVMLAIAEAAETVGDRDHRFRDQFGQITGQLNAIGDLEDITQIRLVLTERTGELAACVDRLTRENEESVNKLKAQVTAYEERLEKAERLSLTDSLTNLINRKGMHSAIESRIAIRRPFALVMIDLNGFKQANDIYGHLAGDEVLRLFAQELTTQFRKSDVVGRWGGDEFVALVEGGPGAADPGVERVRQWAFGDYTVKVGSTTHKIKVSAAIGTASWQPGMTMEQLFKAADAAMYKDKEAMKHPKRLGLF